MSSRDRDFVTSAADYRHELLRPTHLVVIAVLVISAIAASLLLPDQMWVFWTIFGIQMCYALLVVPISGRRRGNRIRRDRS